MYSVSREACALHYPGFTMPSVSTHVEDENTVPTSSCAQPDTVSYLPPYVIITWSPIHKALNTCAVLTACLQSVLRAQSSQGSAVRCRMVQCGIWQPAGTALQDPSAWVACWCSCPSVLRALLEPPLLVLTGFDVGVSNGIGHVGRTQVAVM